MNLLVCYWGYKAVTVLLPNNTSVQDKCFEELFGQHIPS